MAYRIEVDGEYNVSYRMELVQNLDENGELPVVSIATNKPTNNQILAFQGQTAEVPITWVIYNDKGDKSLGSLVSSGIEDDRLALSTDAEVITSSNTIQVEGDYTDRFDSSSTGDVRIYGSSNGNDGTYTVTGTTTTTSGGTVYTNISVSETLNADETGVNVIYGVHTVKEQIVYTKYYVFSPQFGSSWKLFGGRFSSPDGNSSLNGTPCAMTELNIRETADNPLRAEADVKLEIGEVLG